MEFLFPLHPACEVKQKRENRKFYYYLHINGTIMKKLILTSMIAMLSLSILFGQSRTISGKVTDASDGSPLPGVTIVQKGTSNGTVSNHQGEYSIHVPAQGNVVLVFSFVGMITREISPGSHNLLNVTLYPDVAVLQEVVVSGYGSRKLRGSRNKADAELSTPVIHSFVAVDDDFNTETYSRVRETGFKDVRQDPLSTFSIDVDNAAYSNVRRFINSGQLPPPDAVRIEEMLNYFSYHYAEPLGEHPFAMHTELSHCPWNTQNQLLHVGLRAKSIDKKELARSNLVFLIDVSGSMQPANRLPLVKTAMAMLVEELRPQDRVAIVIYASRTAVILESTPASQKEKILAAIAGLSAGGSTAGGQALRMAYDVATGNFISGGNNRIIMCTDGDFNVGESSNAAMERLVEEKRKSGVFITVLGFGMGNYKDDRLEIIANKGNGNYGYIDNIQEARKMLVSEFGGTLFTVAKDVKLQIEFNPTRVKAYRLIGYENRRLNNEDFNDDTKDAGEMGAGHTVTALYEIIPAGASTEIPGIDPLKYQNNTASPVPGNRNAELLTIKTRYKLPDSEQSVMFDLPVRGQILPLARTTDDFRFAAAVAEFGLLTLNSPFKAAASYENILKMSADAKGRDHEGYRAEFINLVRTAQNLDRIGMNRSEK
jgi:Ca-activated chloride channel homolog